MLQRSLAVTVALLAAAACATAPPEDPNAPRACFVVDNSDGIGRQTNIYLVGADSGSRTRIPDVGMGRTSDMCTSRISMPGRFYVLVERPATDSMDPATGDNQPRPIRSQTFLVEPGDTWRWDVRANRLVCTEGVPGDC